MRAYEIAAGSSSLDGLRRCERPDPKPLPTQILVRMQAASLNYRDLLIARGHYMGGAGRRQYDSAVRRRRRSHCRRLRRHAISRRRARGGHLLSRLDRR